MGSAQDDDRGYLQALLEDSLSGAGREVRITGFAGALSARASLETLTIADADGIWLTLNGAQLDWQRSALLRGALEIETLSADSLTLSRLPTSSQPETSDVFSLPELPAPTASTFALPELPVSIRIGDVSIDSVSIAEVVFGAEAEVSLDGSATLAGGEGDVTLRIDRIDGQDGSFQIAGSYANVSRELALSLVLSEAEDGLVANLVDLPDRPAIDLSVQGAGPLDDFAAEIGLRSAGVERLTGDVRLVTVTSETGQADQTFAARLNGDLSPLLMPQYRTFLGTDLRLKVSGARSQAGGLDIDTLMLRSSALNIEGRVSLGVDSWPQKLDLTGRITPPVGDSVLVSIPGAETYVDGAEFSFAYDTARGDEWQAVVELDTLRRDEFGLDIARIAGTGVLTPGDGAPVGRVEGRLGLRVDGIDLGDPALTGAVGPILRGGLQFVLEEDAPFRLSGLSLRGEDYRLSGDVEIDIPDGSNSPVMAGDITLDASDLSRFSAVAGRALSGAVRLDISGDATPLDTAFDLRINGTSNDMSVDIAQLDPLIGGAGTLRLSAARDRVGTRIEDLQLSTPLARITGKTSIGSSVSDGDLSFLIRDVSVLHPDMTGPADLDMTFAQDGLRVNASVAGTGPGGLDVDLAIVTPEGSDQSQANAQITATDLAPYGWLAERAVSGALSLSATGSFDPDTQAGDVTLVGSSTDLSLAIAELDQLLKGRADLALSLRRDADGAIVLDGLNVRSPLLITDVSGSVTAQRTRFRYNLDVLNMAVLVPDLPGAVAAEGVVVTTGGDWQTETQVSGPGGMRAAVTGTVAPEFDRADVSVSGVAPLALANRRLSPNIVSGPLTFDLVLRGPLDLSAVSGTARTEGARLSLPGQKIAFDQIASTVQLGSGRAQVSASLASSNGGTVRIAGPVSLQAPYSGNLTIILDALGLAEPGLFETAADGRLTIDGPLTGGATIAGTVTLGEVGVQVPSGSGGASAALPGLVHRSEPIAARQTRARAGLIEEAGGGSGSAGPPFGLDVLLSAPSRIFIRGRGLDAEMGGALQIRGTTNAVIPSGRFDLVRGRLSILGQRLDLTEGYIQPQGALDPFMRIVADATAGSTDVRFVIEGPVSAPELTMTSSPELPEDEILSRFLFGRDLTQISALQALQIADALATLSGRSSGGAIDRLRQGFGLDDLDVSTTETGETSVRAGKYISDNVYSDVARTTDGQTEINLNLTLTPSLTARGTARSDGGTGIGIYFEKDY